MTVPELSLLTASPTTTDADIVVIGVRASSEGPVLASPDPAYRALADQLAGIGITGAPDELRRLPAPDGTALPVALAGLGSEISPDALRNAAGSAARQLTGVARVAVAFPISDAQDAGAVLEGAAVGAYSFTRHRSSPAPTKMPPAAIAVVVPASLAADADALLARATASAIAVHTVRDLVNTSPAHLYPETLARAAVELADGLPVEVEVLDEEALAAGGFGGILGVGQGSSRGPRLAIVRYAPAGATKHLALVGKGITFDSGGLSLKPAASMVGMKYDMTGSAVVLATTLAAARLGLPVAVTAWMCIAENLPSGTAIRPNDVLTMRGGTTVEVLNTDAEGRLVLADGLVAASEEQPDAIVDVATLTGAARVAMGERTVPVMGDSELATRVVAAGERAGEAYWPMPLPAELRGLLDSDVADIANAKPGNTTGGMLLAGHFLRHFVGSRGEGPDAAPIPWAHLDIAGAANNTGGPYGYTPKGPTGAVVRTLIALTEEFSR